MSEKQGTINLNSNWSKSYASVVYNDSKVAFLGDEKDATFRRFV